MTPRSRTAHPSRSTSTSSPPRTCSPCRSRPCWRWPRAATPSRSTTAPGPRLVAVELGVFADGMVEIERRAGGRRPGGACRERRSSSWPASPSITPGRPPSERSTASTSPSTAGEFVVDRRAVGLGQVDVAEHRRRPAATVGGHGAHRRRRRQHAARRPAGRRPRPPHRVRVPAVPPLERLTALENVADGLLYAGVAAGSGCSRPPRRSSAVGLAGRAGHRPGAAVGRRAPAGRHRPRPRRRPGDRPRRRADGQPRQPHRRGDRRACSPTSTPRPHDRADHPRTGDRGPCPRRVDVPRRPGGRRRRGRRSPA